MLPLNKKLKLIFIGLASTLIICLAINIFVARIPADWNLTKHIDYFFYNIFFTPTLKPPECLVIIDSKSLKPEKERHLYASMIRQLYRAGAKCIALDIYFTETNNDEPEKDRELLNSIKECSSRVILAIDFAEGEPINAIQMSMLEKLALPDWICEYFVQKPFEQGANLPFDSLLNVVKHAGHINSNQNEYYHFPVVISVGRKCFASLPIKIAELHFNSVEDSSQHSENFRIQDVPLDWDDQMLVNFIQEKDFMPLFSWENALQQLETDPAQFLNKIVLIMKTIGETPIPSPLGPYPRWALIASVSSQLLQNRHIEASVVFYPTVISSILLGMSLLWFLCLIPRLNRKWRKTRFIFIPCNVIFLVIIFLLLCYGLLWLGVCIPLLIFNSSLFIVRAKYYSMIRQPQFVDFLVHVLESQDKKYPIKIQSEFGEEEENAFFESFLEEDETFQEILQKIKNLTATREEMRWMGNKLFDAIFQGDIFHLLKNSVEKVQAKNQLLRLRLSIDSPELIRLPWELMHTSRLPPGFLVFNKRISVTRYLSLLQSVKAPEFHIPLKILVMVSNPSDLPPLKIRDEIKVLKKSLRMFRLGGDVRLRFCRKATLENIQKELNRKPDVIHFIGHSYFDSEKKESYLCFETETSHSEFIDEETFGNMLHDSSVKLVILNSCESAASSECDVFTGIAQNLVKIGVPAVLAMQIEIPDKSAIWFSSVFYANFLTNYSIEFAVAEARRFIMDKIKLNRPDWAIPVLFMRSGETFQS